ncbi:TatD family hydrolase [Alteromonas flava]|uniref:TatD family hydrolase n=1 Tax=Alteromonas flava TaxID=2048003 RepID=UPI000C28F014|nr:TatD family hydrolase [Alteromonas flava]
MANPTPNALVDSHCHLDFAVFDADREAIIQHAIDAGVERFLVPGTEARRWPALLAFGQHPKIDIALGLHPYFLTQASMPELRNALDSLRMLLADHQDSVSAIGECGLDAVIDCSMATQIEIFDAQIQLANEINKPLIIHARKTHHLIAERLSANRFAQRGIIHGFSGSIELATSYLERGFLLGIGGTITYPRGNKTRETIKALGLSAIVLETDSPDMPLHGCQGERNTPSQTARIAECVAEILSVSVGEVCQRTTQNYLTLFA